MSERGEPGVRTLTVALVREPPGADHAEVAFYESARFYRLPKRLPAYADSLALLHAAQAAGHAVEVVFTASGDAIGEVRRPDAGH
jgi:hypothetical protein